MDIYFECTVCHKHLKGDRELIGHQLTCPDCQEIFYPVPKNNPGIKAEPAAPELKSKLQADQAAHNAKAPVEKIRFLASGFVAIGFAFVVMGLLILIAGLANSSMGGCITGGSLVGVGLWLVLIGQVIHIRANTHN